MIETVLVTRGKGASRRPGGGGRGRGRGGVSEKLKKAMQKIKMKTSKQKKTLKNDDEAKDDAEVPSEDADHGDAGPMRMQE